MCSLDERKIEWKNKLEHYSLQGQVKIYKIEDDNIYTQHAIAGFHKFFLNQTITTMTN